MKKRLVIIFIFGIFFISSLICISATTHYLTESMGIGIIRPSSFSPAAQPGDTIIISADRISSISLQDFHGTSTQPYIFTNPPNSIAKITQGVIGITVKASDNFKILGNNYPGATYGIEITGVTMSMRFYQCADWEVGYTYQYNIAAGLHHNLDDIPYTPWNSSNSLGDCRFHHNRIVNTTSSEGLYLGHSKISDGSWARFNNLEVDNNQFYNTMWEALQTSHVDGKVTIHDNFIQDPSLADEFNQNKGFNVGVQVAEAEVYNNVVIRARGHGFYASGTGNTKPINVHDNLILENGIGSGDEEDAIKIDMQVDGNIVENNILLKCGRQCIRANNAITTYSNNIMGEAVAGAVLGEELINGGGNIYEANIADIGFVAWSDDGNYSNDNFNLSTGTPTCSEGQITSTCLCGSASYSTGYCCSGVWQSSVCSISTENLIAHWKLDEISGTTVSDSAGNNDGTLMNNPNPLWTTGKFGNALNFDGVDDNVFVNSFSGLENFKGSVSMWIYPESMGEGNKGVIFNMDNSATSGRYGKLAFANTNALKWDVWEGTNFLTRTTSNNILTMNNWNHLVYTFTGIGYTNMKVYVNGVEVSYASGSGTGSPILNNDEFYLGAFNSVGLDAFDGLIDDVRIYDYALTATEILNLYNEASLSNCGLADSNSDGVVNISELMNYISQWKAGNVLIGNLMTAIGEWKNGC